MRALLVVAAGLGSVAPAFALERSGASVRDTGESWARSAVATFSYYNTCTDRILIWNNWADGATVGVEFDIPTGEGTTCPDAYWLTQLESSRIYCATSVPSGYGFTGTISVATAPCGGSTLATQSFLPSADYFGEGYDPWHLTSWGNLEVGSRFYLLITFATPSGFNNPIGICSDDPSGFIGPPPCGTCFPTTRASRTRYFGANGGYCPSGVTLSDGLCDVELMMEASMNCSFHGPVRLEPSSWGSLKGLYR